MAAALTADRLALSRVPGVRNLPVKGNARIFAGAIAAADATGFTVPGAALLGLTVLGIADCAADNTGGADGAISVPARTGVWLLDNSTGADAVTGALRGHPCYLVDDHTVAATDGSNAAANPAIPASRSIAGIVYDVDASGVWVEFR